MAEVASGVAKISKFQMVGFVALFVAICADRLMSDKKKYQ